MHDFASNSIQDLQEYMSQLRKKYDEFKAKGLSYNMSRGKPCTEQLDLSMKMLDYPNSSDSCISVDGTDCRNYGGVDGLPEVKELFSQMLEVSTNEIIIGGNSSLNLMHDTIARAIIHGVYGSELTWGKLPKVKFLCPSPGYDRHFAICELFDIEMINIDMNSDGPDMEAVEKYVREDESIKGIWCIPKYSNPDGITYSDEVVDRLASMVTKAKDFRIFWDNAYVVHHLSDKHDQLKNILEACKAAGNPDRVFIFTSTSKLSFSGAGISMFAASENNINYTRKQISVQTIGPDKINQLRHVHFFKSMQDIEQHMKKHASILKPKFDIVLNVLESELSGKNIAWWNRPNGGYFISFNTMDGCAKAVVAMAAEAGITLTAAGATFPYGKDPRDRNIRLAPSYPSLDELKTAIEVFCICVQLVSLEKIINQKNIG
ncbi:MAG: aminotransferase class I/II-fold pyridoxal phosphate-dependent enzyme [Clostridia bacterium]|nr:aminotransferase class I/II-fold pyridoxal phosphate-dependent enzyme [Clostridia bacterium]